MSDPVAAALATIRARGPGPPPRVALVLGTGLSGLADALDDAVDIPYRDLPGFPRLSVEGHAEELVLGRLGGIQVAVMKGRAHYYETGSAEAMKIPLRALRRAGCEILVLTNAAGGLRREMGPGALMLITDHINLGGPNPLLGAADASRFVDMTDAYDPELRARMLATAEARGIALHQGVYMWFAGPSFETPAEIAAAGVLGADAVGMSTVPEVILARQCGLRVVAISVITNRAAGMGDEPPRHRATLTGAGAAAPALARLMRGFLEDIAAHDGP
ncbi:MAG: purine-nucleoside phosphorylase [Kiloniellaceae bacterium]